MRLIKRGLMKSMSVKGPDSDEVGSKIGAFGDRNISHIVGDVLVTKNPCGNKGDIRLLRAIGKNHPAYPKLKHLVNVLVFSQEGERPNENMMSGGDLDGDVYMVIWDKVIIENVN